MLYCMGSADERDAVIYPYEGFDFGSLSMIAVPVWGSGGQSEIAFRLPRKRPTCYILSQCLPQKNTPAAGVCAKRGLRASRKFIFNWETSGFFWRGSRLSWLGLHFDLIYSQRGGCRLRSSLLPVLLTGTRRSFAQELWPSALSFSMNED